MHQAPARDFPDEDAAFGMQPDELLIDAEGSAVLGESGELKLWNEGLDRPVLALPIQMPRSYP